MKVKGILSIIAASLLANIAFAVSTDKDGLPISGYRSAIISLAGGAAFVQNVGRSQYFPIINPVVDSFYSYTSNHSHQTVGTGDIFVGAEWLYNHAWAFQLGLDYAHQGNFSVNGSLLQGADLQSSDRFTYSYSFTTSQLMAQAKFLYLYSESVLPYLSLGLGGAFNNARNFQTTVPPFLTFTREYRNNFQSSFTYTVGLGLDAAVASRVRLGLGYRFSDLGKVQLGAARIDTTPVGGTLTQEHLYSNAVIAQLTFII